MNKLTFTIVSELASFGYTEDGELFTGEVYFIQAGDKFGNRWSHDHTFSGCKRVEYDVDGYSGICFDDLREEAKKDANKLLDKIVKSGIQDVDGRDHWRLDRPAYGSKAYQAYGQYNDWLEDRLAA